MGNQGKGAGRAVGYGAGLGAGPGGVCICSQCDHEEKHEQGTPCHSLKCPKCGTQLIRR